MEKDKHGPPVEISGLEEVIVSALMQKCQYCKHFGASLKCKVSGKFYHFPCAAASGSFMQKSNYLVVGTDSISKISSLGESKMLPNSKHVELRMRNES